MITELATRTVKLLCNIAIIEEEDSGLYVYGFYILYTYIMYLVIAAFGGMLFGVLWESILFYFLFMLIRGYAGGIHAKTETVCTFLTTLTLLISSLGIMVSTFITYQQDILVCDVLGAVSIVIFSPLDNAEKPLEIEDRILYRRFSILLALGYAMLCIFAYRVEQYSLVAAISISLQLEAILLIAGKISQLQIRKA